MNSKQHAVTFFILAMILATSACKFGQAAVAPTPASTDVPILPTAASTETAVPAEPTVDLIQASNDPVTIGDYTLSFSTVTLSDKGFNGMTPYPMTADQTVLVVEVTLTSGDIKALSGLSLWVNDGQGNRTDSGTTLSVDSKKQVIWLFPVAKTSVDFILHFPSGEQVVLAPLLH